MRKRGRELLVLVAALSLIERPTTARAASAIAGALEPTQVANFIQLIQQCIKAGQQVRAAQAQVNYWKQNVRQFDDMRSFAMAEALVTDVSGLVGQYQTIAFGRDAHIEEFKRTHPGYREPAGANYEKAYRDLDTATMAAVERSLKAVDIQLNDPKGGIKSEQKLIRELAAKARTADGTVKALGVTNELLVVIATQLEKQQLLMAAQAQTMAHYVGNEVQRRSYEEHGRDQFFQFRERYRPSRAPTNWSREASKGLL